MNRVEEQEFWKSHDATDFLDDMEPVTTTSADRPRSTMTLSTSQAQPSRRRLSGPIKIGLAAAAIAAVLVIVGILRGNVPLNPLSILLALLISAGSWGLVAWAVATAAVDVDRDVVEAEAETQVEAEDQTATETQPKVEA